jgi:hypothetical protein
MQRFLFRVQYALPDGTTPIAGITYAYEAVCIRAETEALALAEAITATTRYMTAVGVTRTITLIGTAADV